MAGLAGLGNGGLRDGDENIIWNFPNFVSETETQPRQIYEKTINVNRHHQCGRDAGINDSMSDHQHDPVYVPEGDLARPVGF